MPPGWWRLGIRLALESELPSTPLPCGLSWFRRWHDFISQQFLGLLNAALKIADGVHFAEIYADSDERLGNFGGKTGDDDGSSQEPRSLNGLDKVVGDGNVHGSDASDIDDDDFGAIGTNAAEQLFG